MDPVMLVGVGLGVAIAIIASVIMALVKSKKGKDTKTGADRESGSE